MFKVIACEMSRLIQFVSLMLGKVISETIVHGNSLCNLQN